CVTEASVRAAGAVRVHPGTPPPIARRRHRVVPVGLGASTPALSPGSVRRGGRSPPRSPPETSGGPPRRRPLPAPVLVQDADEQQDEPQHPDDVELIPRVVFRVGQRQQRLIERQHEEGRGEEAEEPLPGEGTERSEEHTSELQSRENLVCRLLLEKKN